MGLFCPAFAGVVLRERPERSGTPPEIAVEARLPEEDELVDLVGRMSAPEFLRVLATPAQVTDFEEAEGALLARGCFRMRLGM